MVTRTRDDADLLESRGGRIDLMRVQQGGFDADARIDQAIAESFPASDAPSWTSGVNGADEEDSPGSRGDEE